MLRIQSDSRIGPTHISIFMGLLYLWMGQDFKNPVQVKARELMPLAKIDGLTTYHCSIRDLHKYGYIVYEPSNDPAAASKVHLGQFDRKNTEFV